MLAQVFGDPHSWPEQDLIGLSDVFDAQLAVAAYCSGVFPMPLHDLPEEGLDIEMGWWSPTQRGVLPLDGLNVSRSLRKTSRRYTTTIDEAFALVLARCGDPSRPHGWIDEDIRRVYTYLHQQGVVHSVETWDVQGRLVGGLYGVSINGLFAGESMFHDPELGRDASKVALMRLVATLRDGTPGRLLDVQWRTDHLASLGVVEVDREDYLDLLDEALELPGPHWPVGSTRMGADELLTALAPPSGGRDA